MTTSYSFFAVVSAAICHQRTSLGGKALPTRANDSLGLQPGMPSPGVGSKQEDAPYVSSLCLLGYSKLWREQRLVSYVNGYGISDTGLMSGLKTGDNLS